MLVYHVRCCSNGTKPKLPLVRVTVTSSNTRLTYFEHETGWHLVLATPMIALARI